jgi:hypothetical protein
MVAAVLESLGEPDAAMEWLERGYEAGATFVMIIGTEWLPFDSLENDPRYIELLRKIGMALGLDGPLPTYRAGADRRENAS